MTTYKIVRFYQRDCRQRTRRTGLTLQEAQQHCSDPETNSKTCTNSAGKILTQRIGPWFDGYEQEQ